jgi:hypothetical protein
MKRKRLKLLELNSLNILGYLAPLMNLNPK